MPRKTVSHREGFSNYAVAQKTKELEAALARIAELETLLAESPGYEVQDIVLADIDVNPNQPRKTFFDVVEMKNLLYRQGQKTPIILVKIPGREKYMIFDGECRYRGANMLNWESIKAIFIPYNPDTFDTDVAIAALNRKNINALDEAECLIYIIRLSLDLQPLEIANKLSAFISFVRRQKKLNLLSRLASDFSQREYYCEEIGFRDEAETRICLDLVDLGRSPISVSNNNFPLLKLTEDLKSGIRERGLNDSIALSLNLINPNSKKLQGKISDSDSLDIRRELMDRIIEEKLPIRSAKNLINQRIDSILGVETQPKNPIFKSLAKLKIEDMSATEKSELIIKLEQVLQKLR